MATKPQVCEEVITPNLRAWLTPHWFVSGVTVLHYQPAAQLMKRTMTQELPALQHARPTTCYECKNGVSL